MTNAKQIFLLFMIIILEGYVVLSAELLAIRQTLPYVGSGSDTISIIIAAVLMPLAFGYYAGGIFKPDPANGRRKSLRKKLLGNIFIAQCFFVFGLSYVFLSGFFPFLIKNGIDNRLVLTTIYSLLFLITPVYLLGQTIPLISNYFSKEKLSEITGRILFFSTLGSFLGAVFSTLVLMTTVGVHNTAGLVFVILTLLIFALSKEKFNPALCASFVITLAALYMNSNAIMAGMHIVENNKYNTITVVEDDGARHLFINNNRSSKYTDEGRKHAYVELIENITIKDEHFSRKRKKILVIGAGGFTFGFEDLLNDYDYVDIDGSLKDVAEKYILKQKLSENKKFHAMPVRAYLTGTNEKYDLILIDVFQSGFSIPEQLVTREFFMQVREHLNENGIVAANFSTSPNFANPFSRTLDNTFRSVFPYVSRHIMHQGYVPWSEDKRFMNNAIYIYRHHPEEDTGAIYTDDKNRAFLDRPTRMY